MGAALKEAGLWQGKVGVDRRPWAPCSLPVSAGTEWNHNGLGWGWGARHERSGKVVQLCGCRQDTFLEPFFSYLFFFFWNLFCIGV